MSNKITKALSFFTGLTRGSGKPVTASTKPGTTGPASNATLQSLARLKTSPSAVSSPKNGTARPRLSARDLPRAGAATRARAQALATAREVARIEALPSPALPLDIQRRFDALKANMPKTGVAMVAAEHKSATTDEKNGNDALPQAILVNLNVSLSTPVAKAEGHHVEDVKAGAPKTEDTKTEDTKTEGPAAAIADPHQEIAALEGKVHDHVNAMHNAVAAHPAQPPYDLFQQEMAELQQLAVLISRILQRLVQHSGQALLSITRN